ncbi:hypothetical protein [Rhizobacter sp. OV335]|uniref:hypothetical protein n=1 Tax=Rhizobacter sp. OV335 TaxID=1500264 RepID=UPI000911B072|nr:hypothetical protein [Rhizobacter sp. OV335]SHN29968.1 hypothetical protein SAMN02787076_04915 [Rhizobacter sp. OV335]
MRRLIRHSDANGSYSSRRRALMAAGAALLATGCGQPRLFELTIFEEVRLRDGPLLLLKRTIQFERGGYFSGYQNARRRVTTLVFDAGTPLGSVKFTTWLTPVFLDRIAGRWYLVLAGQGPFGKTDETSDQWGHGFTTREQRLATLDGRTFHPMGWESAPPSIQRENLFPSIDVSLLAGYDGKRVSFEEKEVLLQDAYLDPARREISRPLKIQVQ